MPNGAFEFRASLGDLEEGLEILHLSVERLRERLGRPAGDGVLMQFETALAEIGGNALAHTNASPAHPVEYVLHADATKVVAWVVDRGAAVTGAGMRKMPPAANEAGRGLPLARSLLDELTYERLGTANRWKLVKRL